jgi:hypothetical protein
MPTSSLTPSNASTTNEHFKAYHGLALRGPRGREQNCRTTPHAFSGGGHVPGRWSRSPLSRRTGCDYSRLGSPLDSHNKHSMRGVMAIIERLKLQKRCSTSRLGPCTSAIVVSLLLVGNTRFPNSLVSSEA